MSQWWSPLNVCSDVSHTPRYVGTGQHLCGMRMKTQNRGIERGRMSDRQLEKLSNEGRE